MPIVNITLEMWIIFCIIGAITITTIYILDTKKEKQEMIAEQTAYHKQWEKKLKAQDKKSN